MNFTLNKAILAKNVILDGKKPGAAIASDMIAYAFRIKPRGVDFGKISFSRLKSIRT